MIPGVIDPTTEAAVRLLLETMGLDTEAEGLRETPRRVAAFYNDRLTKPQVTFTTFENPGVDEMIVQAGIRFYSLCEHHMVPFFGEATVAYLPHQRILGLSKLARIVDVASRGLRTQEAITRDVADLLERVTQGPRGVGVVLRARHLCMEMRGIRAVGAESVTSDLRGVLRDDGRARSEFLTLARVRQ